MDQVRRDPTSRGQPAAVDEAFGDESLIAGVCGRDEHAYRELIDRHLDTIHGYLARMTGNPHDAEDLAQETFLKVWQKADTYQPGRVKVSTWLHTIAHNLCIDSFRRKRELLTATGELPERQDPSAGPEARLVADDESSRLLAAINRLPDTQRSALLLCQIQGFSNAEAAAIMDLGVRALESLLARARRTLKSTLFANGEPT